MILEIWPSPQLARRKYVLAPLPPRPCEGQAQARRKWAHLEARARKCCCQTRAEGGAAVGRWGGGQSPWRGEDLVRKVGGCSRRVGIGCRSDPEAADAGLRPVEAGMLRVLGEGDRRGGHLEQGLRQVRGSVDGGCRWRREDRKQRKSDQLHGLRWVFILFTLNIGVLARFPVKKTEAQKGEMTCPEFQSWDVEESGFELAS